ncbi:MAG: hypothetical protein L3J98_06230 [Gammaproteobacteria bacterium]|nr:hypothetical protein [Gammaproteobacteria bacterium]
MLEYTIASVTTDGEVTSTKKTPVDEIFSWVNQQTKSSIKKLTNALKCLWA